MANGTYFISAFLSLSARTRAVLQALSGPPHTFAETLSYANDPTVTWWRVKGAHETNYTILTNVNVPMKV